MGSFYEKNLYLFYISGFFFSATLWNRWKFNKGMHWHYCLNQKYTPQDTPTSSLWWQLWVPHPADPHWAISNSAPPHLRSSSRIVPLPWPKCALWYCLAILFKCKRMKYSNCVVWLWYIKACLIRYLLHVICFTVLFDVDIFLIWPCSLCFPQNNRTTCLFRHTCI